MLNLMKATKKSSGTATSSRCILTNSSNYIVSSPQRLTINHWFNRHCSSKLHKKPSKNAFLLLGSILESAFDSRPNINLQWNFNKPFIATRLCAHLCFPSICYLIYMFHFSPTILNSFTFIRISIEKSNSNKNKMKKIVYFLISVKCYVFQRTLRDCWRLCER